MMLVCWMKFPWRRLGTLEPGVLGVPTGVTKLIWHNQRMAQRKMAFQLIKLLRQSQLGSLENGIGKAFGKSGPRKALT